ncbi:MAG: NADH-ubiquinone oxidoreductase-F iron-sulfur binding region domain-containing protein [Velocimicrobium sp.]
MKDIILCNAMPIYKEAPVSQTLLKHNIDKVVSLLMKREASKHYLMVPKGEFQGNIPEGLTIIEEERGFGFVFENNSSLIKVLEGEKPIPSFSNRQALDENIEIVTVEELLELEIKTVYIGGKAKKNGAFEFERKITPRDIVNLCGTKEKFKGMFFGYPMGCFVDESKLDEAIDLTTDYVEIIDETDCMLDCLLSIANRFGQETCGRCVFGHEGVTQIQMILSDMTLKRGKTTDIELLMDLCSEMKNQSLCEIGESVANTITTAIECFKEEIEAHITKKSCKAGVCAKFITYHILPDMCTGCNECEDECEEDAILGKKRFIHVIDQDECTQCGACVEACEEKAIVKAGAVKPRCPQKPIPCKR